MTYTRENLLEETIKIYNISDIIKYESNGKYQAHMSSKVALIEKANGGYIFADYEAIVTTREKDGKYHFEIEETEGTTPDENGHYVIHVVGCGWFTITLYELWKRYIPIATMKAKDFFTKRDYNPRCEYNFNNMIRLLNE